MATTIENYEQQIYEYTLNALSTRLEFFDRLLEKFGHDIDKEAGYPAEISAHDYRSFYDRMGIAQRVVNLWPKESWKVSPVVRENEDPEDTEFEEAVQELGRNLMGQSWLEERQSSVINSQLKEVDIKAGIGRYGVLLLGFNDGKDLSEPIDSIDERGNLREGSLREGMELMWMEAYDESNAEVLEVETDQTNPRLGQPVLYNIHFRDGTEQNSSTTNKVHWHRVIHHTDNGNTYHAPRMEPVFNRIIDLRKILPGSGEMFWQGGFGGVALEPISPEVSIEGQEDNISEAMSAYRKGLKRYIAMEGLRAKSLEVQIADPNPHFMVQMKAISITLEIPLRKLLGSEQGELASSQDVGTWNERLSIRQVDVNTPLVRKFYDRMILVGVLPIPEKYFIEWPDIDQPTEREIAETGRTITEALRHYVQGDVESLIGPRSYLVDIMGRTVEEAEAMLEEAMEIEEEEPEPDIIPEPEEEEDENE